MIKRFIQLIKIARKLASSGALDTINQLYKLPLILKIFFDLISIGSEKKFLTILNPLVKNCATHWKVWELLLSN